MKNFIDRYKLLIAYDKWLSVKRIEWKQSYKLREVFGRLVRLFLTIVSIIIRPFSKTDETEKVDFLVLGTGQTDISQTKHLWDQLRLAGYSVKILVYDRKQFFKTAMTASNVLESKLPFSLRLYDLYAKRIWQRYQPTVLCSFFHHTLIPSFIQMNKPEASKTIFIPHAAFAALEFYSNFEFDYYGCFGQKSLDNLKKSAVRLGVTKVLKIGSSVLPAYNGLAPTTASRKFLMFSDWWQERTGQDIEYFEIVKNWILKNNDSILYIRLHPSEKGDLLRTYFKDIPNVSIIDKSVDMKSALMDVSICIHNYSAASIDAAIHNRPVITVNHLKYDEKSSKHKENDHWLNVESFFGSRCRNSEELSEAVEKVSAEYDSYVQLCKRYVDFHIEGGLSSAQNIIELLAGLHSDVLPQSYWLAEEKVDRIHV